MKHVKLTSKNTPAKAKAHDPAQEKKEFAFRPFCPDGFDKDREEEE